MNTNVIRRLVQVFLTLLIQGVILFAAAGTLFWKWAWILLLLSVVILIINLLVIPVELIEERGRLQKDAKKWDKVLTSINIIPTVLLYVCSGLDYRFNLTGNVNILINITGLILSFSGAMLFTWSMISNKFFSTLVRLQTERKHIVATGGPYRFVRHPGYVGYIIMSFATPIALGTLWGLIFSGITGILLIIRTALEDNILKRELAGYAEYAEKVKYRLIPFLW